MTAEQQNKLIQDLWHRLSHEQLYITKDIYKADTDKFLHVLYKVVNVSDLHIEVGIDDLLRIKIRLNEDLISLHYDTNTESSDKILKDIETIFIPIKLMANAYFINKLNEQFGGVNVEYNESIFNKMLDERLATLANEGGKKLSDIVENRIK